MVVYGGYGEDLVPGKKYTVTINEGGVERTTSATAVTTSQVEVSTLPPWLIPVGAGVVGLGLVGLLFTLVSGRR